jgi:hypothetical protein
VLAPIYVSIMWDDLAGEKEPGWVIARRDGSLMIRPPLQRVAPGGGMRMDHARRLHRIR